MVDFKKLLEQDRALREKIHRDIIREVRNDYLQKAADARILAESARIEGDDDAAKVQRIRARWYGRAAERVRELAAEPIFAPPLQDGDQCP